MQGFKERGSGCSKNETDETEVKTFDIGLQVRKNELSRWRMVGAGRKSQLPPRESRVLQLQLGSIWASTRLKAGLEPSRGSTTGPGPGGVCLSSQGNHPLTPNPHRSRLYVERICSIDKATHKVSKCSKACG